MTHIARCALEVWRGSGKRTESRLFELVAHYAATNGETALIEEHRQAAIAAVKPWELETS
jgi:hypothetical protein